MSAPWSDEIGVVVLLDGRRVRGRALADRPPPELEPDFSLYLGGRPPPEMAWETQWLNWPDFGLPRDASDANIALEKAFARSLRQRVEIACRSGIGRTGTALACLAVLAGTPPEDAVAYVRTRYRHNAVETPWQRRYVRRFGL
ncbi:MAG TPA: protein-tyrosine phosphatase family protein [Acidimicrobiia bacterium]|nr:protein-tyrosine phosphatase family protein [Acidimicrobiia bacterium]